MAKIYKMFNNDLFFTKFADEDTYYFCTDTAKLWADLPSVVGSTRNIIDYVFIETELQRFHDIIPEPNKNYYVYETNELWTYNRVWILKAGNISANAGYYHDNNNVINALDTGYEDNNGLLGDGSLVIRDPHRTIKGRIFVDPTTNNLCLSSFMGGGLTLLPYGVTDTIRSVGDPVYYYDENNILQKVEDVPDYNASGIGRFDININNVYNVDSTINHKDLDINLSDIIKIHKEYKFYNYTESYISDYDYTRLVVRLNDSKRGIYIVYKEDDTDLWIIKDGVVDNSTDIDQDLRDMLEIYDTKYIRQDIALSNARYRATWGLNSDWSIFSDINLYDTNARLYLKYGYTDDVDDSTDDAIPNIGYIRNMLQNLTIEDGNIVYNE